MYRVSRFWAPVTRVNPSSEKFLIDLFVFPIPENTLKVENETKKIFEKKFEKINSSQNKEEWKIIAVHWAI